MSLSSMIDVSGCVSTFGCAGGVSSPPPSRPWCRWPKANASRESAKSRTKSGFYRRKQHKKFRLKTYHRRSIVEAVFSRIKRLFGSTVRCRRARTIRAELFARFIAHNLTELLNRHFQLSQRNRKPYK